MCGGAGLLSGRGANINSLTVCESEVKGLSRMTLSVIARQDEVRKMIAQLEVRGIAWALEGRSRSGARGGQGT